MLNKRDSVAAKDMLGAARRAVDYATTVSIEEFARDRMRIDAAMAAVMIVGEASKRISVEGRSEFEGINWRELSDVRQYVVHKYFLVDPGELHRAKVETVTGMIPALELALAKENLRSSPDGGSFAL